MKYFAFCYNILYNATLNHEYTPFELVFARKCNLPDMLTEKIEPIYNFDNFVKIAKNTLQRAHKIAQNLVNKSKLANKAIYDKNCNPIDVAIGDLVLLCREP